MAPQGLRRAPWSFLAPREVILFRETPETAANRVRFGFGVLTHLSPENRASSGARRSRYPHPGRSQTPPVEVP